MTSNSPARQREIHRYLALTALLLPCDLGIGLRPPIVDGRNTQRATALPRPGHHVAVARDCSDCGALG